MPVKFKGRRVVIGKLRKEINSIQDRTAKGLIAAALFVKEKSQELVPHDKGVLLNSAYIKPVDRRYGKLFIELGYTAKYAPFVHEMPSTTKWSKQGTGAKFLQNPLTQNTQKILKIIKDRVEI